jgi:hypothetical protein
MFSYLDGIGLGICFKDGEQGPELRDGLGQPPDRSPRVARAEVVGRDVQPRDEPAEIAQGLIHDRTPEPLLWRHPHDGR